MQQRRSGWILAVLFLAACGSNNKAAPFNPWGINHQREHQAGQCPAWNGWYLSHTTGATKQMKTSFDENMVLILTDKTPGDWEQFAIDGTPKAFGGDQNVSYTGWCPDTQHGTLSAEIKLEFYENQKAIYTLEYIVNTAAQNSFEVIKLDPEKNPLPPAPDTYYPAPHPTPTPQPSPSPTQD